MYIFFVHGIQAGKIGNGTQTHNDKQTHPKAHHQHTLTPIAGNPEARAHHARPPPAHPHPRGTHIGESECAGMRMQTVYCCFCSASTALYSTRWTLTPERTASIRDLERNSHDLGALNVPRYHTLQRSGTFKLRTQQRQAVPEQPGLPPQKKRTPPPPAPSRQTPGTRPPAQQESQASSGTQQKGEETNRPQREQKGEDPRQRPQAPEGGGKPPRQGGEGNRPTPQPTPHPDTPNPTARPPQKIRNAN